MQRSFVRQTRLRITATQDAVGNRDQSEDGACAVIDDPEITIDDSFVPSLLDLEHGNDRECAECDRPNNAELYMVQCGGCKRWYHFSCAKVDPITVRAKDFSCTQCFPNVPQQPSSSIAGRSSVSSARRAQIARDLERLEEERLLQDQVEEERLRMERQLVDKAIKDKLQRQKEYIARKHELLRQQDDEISSIRSRRSSRSSIQKVEAWVKQHVKLTGDTEIRNVPEAKNVDQQISPTPVSSSTPLMNSGISAEVENIDGVATSIPRTTDSVTIGESVGNESDSVNGHQRNPSNHSISPKMQLVDIQSYDRLLEESDLTQLKIATNPTTHKTGTIPKLMPKPMGKSSPYEVWQRETSQLRQQQGIELQRRHNDELKHHEQRERELEDRLKQTEDQRDQDRQRLCEIENVLQRHRNLESKHREENNLRRKREMDLVAELKRLEQQHLEERNELLMVEDALQKQLEMSHQQYQNLVVARKHEQAERDEDRRRFRLLEQQLADHQNLLRLRDQSHPFRATELQPVTPTVTTQSMQNVSKNRIPQLERSEMNNFPNISTPSPSVVVPLDRVGTPHTFTVPPEIGRPYVGPQSQPQLNPLGPYYVGPQGQSQFNPYRPPELNSSHHDQFPLVQYGPTNHQLAARQVIPKELPIFCGDPLDWPLFISSYNHSNEACGYSDSENLLRLQRSLKGEAKESVSSFLLHPSTLPQILSTLKTLYGRPEQIVHNMVAKVRATPAPKAERLETIVQFGLVVQNLCGHLKAVGLENHLSNPILLQELVDKLPATFKFSWALYQENLPIVDLKAFGEYMGKVTSATSGVTNLCMTTKGEKEEKPRPKEKAYVNTHTAYDRRNSEFSSNQPKSDRRELSTNDKGKESDGDKCCLTCKAKDHLVANCLSFKQLSLDERWRVVKENKLCRRCLVSHNRWPCEGEVCGVNGCQKRHHQLLHYEPASGQSVVSTNATVTIHRQPISSTLFKILPVTLYGKNGSVDTYAFLDDGSSVTLVEKTIADELGADGKTQSLCIQWTSGINKKITSTQLVKLGISGADGRRRFDVSEVYTVENLGLPEQTLDFGSMKEQYKHFRNLPIKSFQRAVPGLLIGLNNSHLMATLKLREGEEKEPIAVKTRIGWTVCGSLREGDHQFQHRQMHMCAEPAELDLHEYVREFFSVESLGVSAAPNLEGSEDQRARRILEETTVKTTNGKFETALLWKYDSFEFPDSRPMAERRLKCLEKRLERDPQLYESVRHQIADYQAKGYIHAVTEEEMAEFDPQRTWYLPLGVVLNPNKPGKIRVIWDAAAKVNGVSLNTMLLTGPDLLTPQLSVMFKFREREVAFSGDIQEMFLQVGIRRKDRSALLFVFRISPSHPMITMVSDVAIFGATCSPAQSQYVKNLNATENEKDHPRAAAAIKNRHYVDDYLDSVNTEEEAIELALEVAEVHRKAGFHIRNWVSNRPKVLEAIGEVNPASVKNLTLNNQSGFERLLGISWLPGEDMFCFSLSLQGGLRELAEGVIAPTKRMMLSFVMKIYDPLGLVGSLIVQGKILIQEVWRAKVDWDEQIPENIFKAWKLWLHALQGLDNVRIPRCYFPGYEGNCYDSLELHIFVDGSAQAYSAVAYFRVQDRGEIRCALVASKTKVAPLQLTSIPRLELQAAVLGARLRKTIEEGHSIQVKKTYIWSDSSTVISWISSDTRRYRQYVAFRVNEILSLSKVDEWRWLGTRINVADEATKWGKGPDCRPDSRWMRGPAFLYEEKDKWPSNEHDNSEETKEELRSAYICSHLLVVPVIEIERFSKYERLLRSVAYVHRFQKNSLWPAKRTQCTGAEDLSSEELQTAERTLWRLAQSECYPDEVATLKRNVHLEKEQQKGLLGSSSIAKLPPLIDEHGVLRVDSRIAAADYVAYDTRYPIILPRGHGITNLLLDWYHRKFRHANNETIVNEVRQRFYIAKLRSQVRSAALRCQWCRVYKSKPASPKMGQLPRIRLTPFLRPFTFVGIDYFGPYFVKVGRSAVKRWVAVFTCLTVRAIHLEIVFSLTADSCKKAIRRFIACRGAPQEIYTDNGTNFVGASRELEAEIRELNVSMSSTFTDAHTKWQFNPPSAPHMGGCLERMVRSVKTALGCLPTSRKLDDESFMTLLSEAAHMVNSRPLTYVPLDSEERESLTPNHFLMLSSSGVRQQVKDPVDQKKAVIGSWKLLQHMLDEFWRRWIVEYLPMISRRTKWFQDVAPIKENALVLIADEGVRNRWIRGRVIRTYPGKDGVVRRADVTTSSGVLQRPVCKLAVLDIRGDDKGRAEIREDADAEPTVFGDGDVESVFERHEGEDVPTSVSIPRPLVQF